jgi:D-apionolactonase
MTGEPVEAIKLFGTDEPSPAAPILRAGSLTAEFDAGNLRHIRVGGVEVIRAVSFIVRDRNWGTYNPVISDLKTEETGDGFTVRYEAVAGDENQKFRYQAEIDGNGDGRLVFRCKGEAVTDFLTNRTGFVVLHPAGVAGLPVEIEHVSGEKVAGQFPELIDPVQPMMDLRALTHEAAPGLRVSCRMEGDTFEMEDQRNWTDASYKTYVRPLALPWPYTLKAGTTLEQAVSLTVTMAGAAQPASSAGGVTVTLGEAMGAAPQVGLGYDPDEDAAANATLDKLAAVKPHHLICHHDPRRGHDRSTLETAVAVAYALGAKPWLEAVITEVENFEEEVAALGTLAADLGSPFEVVMLSPAPDLKCTLPGSVWPPAPPADALFRAARKAFPNAKLGGGMFSYFTELNRKRPPLDQLDLVSFTTSALVHAGDDISVMEGLEALPAIAASAREIAGGLPLGVGPSAMGMRMNPYGEAPMENPRNIRQAMNRNDPRQRGLLGAAWTLGYYAHFARGGASALAIGGLTGPHGIIHARQSWPQPWYDENGGLFPVFHVLRGLAGLSGRSLRALEISDPSAVQGVAVEAESGIELWLANLTGREQSVSLPVPATEAAVLDASSFVEASRTPDLLDRLAPLGKSALTLGPYSTMRIMVDRRK